MATAENQEAVRVSGESWPERKRNVLFIQTDWEMGLCRLACDLQACGHRVTKVALNAADLYYRLRKIRTLTYRQPLKEWRGWLKRLVDEEKIDTFVVYNKYRPYNHVAAEVADEMDVEVVEVEQGLIRPLHVTAFSTRNYSFEVVGRLWESVVDGRLEVHDFSDENHSGRPVSSRTKLIRMGFFGLIALLTRRSFRHYEDQLPMRLRYFAKGYLVNGWRYWRNRGAAKELERLVARWSGKYFLLPLQVPHDAQIVYRSPFQSMDDVLRAVVDSFEKHAAPDQKLLIKIHPMDRGFHSYRSRIAGLKDRLGDDRVELIDRADLSLLLPHAAGVVTVNSTVGLTALRHGCPVKALGEAVYDQPGIVFRGSLDEFWEASEDAKPDRRRLKQFLALLELTIQGRGMLAKACHPDCGKSGIVWPAAFRKMFGLT